MATLSDFLAKTIKHQKTDGGIWQIAMSQMANREAQRQEAIKRQALASNKKAAALVVAHAKLKQRVIDRNALVKKGDPLTRGK